MCDSQILVTRHSVNGKLSNITALNFWFLFVFWLLVSDLLQALKTINKLSPLKKKKEGSE